MQATYLTATRDQIASLTSYQSTDGVISVVEGTCAVTQTNDGRLYIFERKISKTGSQYCAK